MEKLLYVLISASFLDISAENSLYESCKLLIKSGANINAPDSNQDMPLRRIFFFSFLDISASRSLKCVQIFLKEKNIKVNEKNSKGETPIKIAIENKKNEIALALIKTGADINFLLGKIVSFGFSRKNLIAIGFYETKN